MDMATCANPGCDHPGTIQCNTCKTIRYCGQACQAAHWIHHRVNCEDVICRKVGMAHLAKAKVFHQERNYAQSLHHAELASTKLKQLKERPVEIIDGALSLKFHALQFMGKHKEALECSKEWYCLWPTTHTHPPAIIASFSVIESCIFNKEYFDAALYARTLWETITLSRDSHIPEHQVQEFTARGAMELARALWQLVQHGDMPPEEQQEAGVEAIMLARRALEINTRLYGTESSEVANGMTTLACILNCFNDVDDDEVPRLHEQSIAIYARLQGSSSTNVASGEYNFGEAYNKRARRAHNIHDLDRYVVNLELALSHIREATRICRDINLMDMADRGGRRAVEVEEKLRQIVAERAAATRR